jgi:hypothetical protein
MLLWLAVLSVCACGSSTAPIDPNMAGSWVGTTTIAITTANSGQGQATSAQLPENVVVTVSGNTAEVAGVCPDASGSVSASGAIGSCSWSAAFSCPAISTEGCSAVSSTYTSGTVGCAMMMNGGGMDVPTLTVNASGTAAGCGVTHTSTLSSSGTLAP